MQKSEQSAVDELLQTYSETGGINYLAAAAMLPSRLAVEEVCTELMSLMFPGFRSETVVNSEDLAEITRARSCRDLPHGACLVRNGAAHPADHDRMGAQSHRYRHSPWRKDRPAFLHRP